MTNIGAGGVAAIIVAGGRGSRAPGDLPKQYRLLGGEAVLARTLRAFLAHPRIAHVTPVIHPDDADLFARIAPSDPRLRPAVAGGGTRQDSVRLGIESLALAEPDLVLIHDAARPMVSAAVIDRVVDGLTLSAAVLPAVAVPDTLKRGDASGRVVETVSRDGLFGAQTPQGFAYAAIRAAHASAAARGLVLTDDAAVAEAAGIRVQLVPGDPANLKLTTAEDFLVAERQLGDAYETRVATGYDVHRLGPGDHVTLGGIRIAHDRSLIGHSDADVALHALTDALLGTIGAGDIGSHFPPSDPQWRGASSDRFLRHAAQLVAARGGRIIALDLSIIAEAPKIGPHREAMRARIAEIAGIAVGRVAVKATTNEGIGFIGRGEGIAALATATVALPGGP